MGKIYTGMPSALVDVLRKAKSFAIVGHVKPDADTLGSSLALASLIRRISKGKKRRIVLANASLVPEQLRFMPSWQKVVAPAKRNDLKDVECAIYLECATPERAGGIAVPSDFKTTVNIDHHHTGKGFADINWINPKASSNSEQMYLLFEKFGQKVNREESIWLYSGIVTDTGRFQYSLTSPKTHSIAADLLSTGIPFTKINERLFTIKTVEHLKLLSRALTSMRFYKEGHVSLMKITAKDFEEFDYHATQTEDIVNYGLAPEQVQISFLIKEEPFRGRGVISVSLRSRGNVDISPIAESLGGGGHKNAAGCEVTGKSVEEMEQLLLERAEAALATAKAAA